MTDLAGTHLKVDSENPGRDDEDLIRIAEFFIMISTAIQVFFQNWCRRESSLMGWHVSQSQIRTLRLLYARTNSTVGDVATHLGIKSQTLSTILRRVGKLGMVEKNRDPGNKQRVLLSLGAGGKCLVEKYDQDLLSEFSHWMGNMKSAEVRKLLSAARGFTRALVEEGDDYLEPKLSASIGRMAGVVACNQAICDFLAANAYRYLSEALSGSKVSALQLRILAHLDYRPTSMTDLANHLGVTMPTVSSAVRVLEKHGMARSEKASGNKRRKVISSTGLGKKVVLGYRVEFIGSIHRAARSGLCNDEVQATLRANEVLIDTLSDNAGFLEDLEVFRSIANDPAG